MMWIGTVTIWFPLVAGCGVVYHPNPTDAKAIGELVAKYRATLLLSTPTFCSTYTRKCAREDFASLRFALVGAGLANGSPVIYRTAGRVPGVPAGAGIATTVGIGYAGLLAGPPGLGFVGKHAGLTSILFCVMLLSCVMAFSSRLVRGLAMPAAR